MTAASIPALFALAPPAVAQSVLPPVVVEASSIAVSPPGRRPVPAQSSGSQTQTSAAPPAGDTAAAAPLVANEAAAAVSPGQLAGNQGTAVTVITSEQIRDQQIRTPVDALRSQPGVAVSRTGSFAGLAQVRLRGNEANQTLVLVDGIEVNNPGDGEFDFSNIVGGEEIQRIEVLRGPQSGLYGSGAIGGVVNIVTRSGMGPPKVTARVEGGSFGTRDVAATASAGNERAWGLVGIQSRKTDGFNIARFGDERDGSQTTSSLLKAGFSPLQGFSIEGTLRQTTKRGDRDEENYFVPGVLVRQIDAPSKFSSDFWVGALEAKLALFDGAWTQSLRTDRRAITNDDLSVNPAFGGSGLFDRYKADSLGYRYTSTFRLDTPGAPQVRHFLTGLAEKRHDTFNLYTNDAVDHDRKLNSYAGELKGEYWNTLFLTGSVRRDESDVFGDFSTWRTTASLKVPDAGVRLHGSMGTGVKLPSMFEQFGRIPNFFKPNPNLKPEEAKGWDSGIEVTLFGGRAIVDATWFDTELTNKIQSVNAGSTVANIAGVSTRRGLELASRVLVAPGLTVGGAYTWLEAEQPNGVTEIRRPGNTARIDATYTFDRERARIGLAAIYNGSMIDEAFRTANPGIFPLAVQRVTLDDYWVLSATAAYKVAPGVELYARGENLADQRYQQIYGFASPGIAAYGGIRIELNPLAGDKLAAN